MDGRIHGDNAQGSREEGEYLMNENLFEMEASSCWQVGSYALHTGGEARQEMGKGKYSWGHPPASQSSRNGERVSLESRGDRMGSSPHAPSKNACPARDSCKETFIPSGQMEIGGRSLAKVVPSRVLPVEERTAQDEQEDREDCKWPVCVRASSW